LALSDAIGARTLMREIDDVLRRRPGLGTLVGEAQALRAQLAKVRGTSVPAPSALTAAELRLLPMLPSHLSFAEIGGQLSASPHTAKAPGVSSGGRLIAGPGGRGGAGPRELGLLEG